LDPHDVYDPGEIVGKNVQRHFGGDLRQRLHQEVGCSHPGLDRAEGMLDRLPSLAHLLRVRIEPALHHLENVLMLPSLDPSLVALDKWPAPGSADTELGVFMGLEVGHGETKVYAGVQA
jgi:hypothetical protein